MTREEAKQLLPVIQAYSEGRKIQFRKKFTEDEWQDTSYLNETQEFTYRIKPEASTPTYRPFKDAQECWEEMQKHQPFGWLKKKNKKGLYVQLLSSDGYLEDLYNGLTFADGTPFGTIDNNLTPE